MTEQKKETPEEKPPVKKQSESQKALAALMKLSPEARNELALMGITVPEHSTDDLVDGQHTKGYRCSNCQRVGLYFVGSQWRWPDGSVRKEIPAGATIDSIPWTQNLPIEKIDRARPACQHCVKVLPLDGRVIRRRLIVDVEQFEAVRDKSYDRKVLAAQIKERTQGASLPEGIPADYALRAENPIQHAIDKGSLTEQDQKVMQHIVDKYGLATQFKPGM